MVSLVPLVTHLGGLICQIVLAAAELWLVLAAGKWVLTAPNTPLDRPAERLCLYAVFGAGLVATIYLLFGLFGLLKPLVVAGVPVALLFGARTKCAEVTDELTAAVRAVRNRTPTISLALTGVIFLAMLLLALMPVTDPDSLSYHLPVPAYWLNEGVIQLPPSNLHAAFVGLPHLLYLPGLLLDAHALPALLSVGFCVLLALGAHSLARDFFGEETASLALPLIWSSPMLLLVAVTPRIDTTLAFFLFVVHLLVLRAYRLPDDTFPLLAFACLSLGLAIGVKYSALAYGLALSPFVVWILYRSPPPNQWTVPVLVLGGLIVGGALPWLLKNFLLFDAPLYPYFTGRQLEPWLRPLYGTTHVPASIPDSIFRGAELMRVKFNLTDVFLQPGRLSPEIQASLYWPSLILLLLPLWLRHWKRPVVGVLILPPLLFVAIILLYSSGLINLRYFSPVLIPLTIVGGYFLVQLFPDNDKATQFLHSASLTLLLLPLGYAVLTLTRVHPMPQFLTTDLAHNSYLRKSNLPHVARYGHLVDRLNRLPSDSRILLLYESRDYYINRPTIGGSIFMSDWPLLVRVPSPPPCPASFGATHVVIHKGLAHAISNRIPSHRWERFSQYRSRCLTRDAVLNTFSIYSTHD